MNEATTRTNRFVTTSLGCLLVLLIVVGPACRKQESPAPEADRTEPNTTQVRTPTMPGTPDETVAPEPVDPVAVAVTVNGEAITEAQLDERIDFYLRSNPQMANLPPQFMSTVKAQLRPRMLDALISQFLLNQQVEAAGIKVSDQEVLAVMEQRGAAQNPPVTVDQLKEMIESRGASFEQVKEQFREGIALERFMEDKLAGKTDVTDEEAKTFYDENPERFAEPEQVQASHILIRFSDPADPNADPNEAKAAAKAKAEGLLAQIKGGADFAELATAHSADPGSKTRGGDLGFFARGDMVPPFEEAAFGQEIDAISDVVETRFGYHIIKTTGHKDARTIPFEEAKPQIVQQRAGEKRNEFVQEYLESLKEEATIVYPAGNAPPTTMAPTVAPSTPPVEAAPVPAPTNTTVPVEPNTN